MLCPLIKSDCVTTQCAWFDHGNKCCAILGLVVETIKLGEHNAPATRIIEKKSDASVIVNPVIHTREIIKHILPEVKHDSITSSPPNKASEPLPTVSWFKPSEEGDTTGAGATDDAGTEPEDVGDQPERADSNWSQDIPGQDLAVPTDVHGLG